MRIAILCVALITTLFFQIITVHAAKKGQNDGMKFHIRILSPEQMKRYKEMEKRQAEYEKKTKATTTKSSTKKTEPSATEKTYEKKKQEEKKIEPTKRWE